MTPSALASLASLLYPSWKTGRPAWQTPLSLALRHPHHQDGRGVGVRLVRAWASGERPIPSWVEGEMVRLLRERREEISKALEASLVRSGVLTS